MDHIENQLPGKAVLVIHGGAGVLSHERITPAYEKRYLAKLKEALVKGHAVLKRGGTSLDAVEAAVKVLEDSPLFNAGKGAVFTREGKIELDAAIMDGATRKAGAIGFVTTVKNPISLARAVMEHTPHVLLCGKGADSFARKIADKARLKLVDPSYFWTKKRWEQLQEALANEKGDREKDSHARHTRTHQRNLRSSVLRAGRRKRVDEKKFGTVGAVAVDREGNLAAATSTGGTTAKQFGRVGDSPLIGSGTYADNATCAVSCTGHGEFFIRYVAAYDVAARMKYAGEGVVEAANNVIHEALMPVSGDGGLIAIDSRGNFAMPFNTEGMFRGCITEDGETHVAIFRD